MTRKEFTSAITNQAAANIKFRNDELGIDIIQFTSEHVMLITPDSVRNFPPEGAFKINYSDMIGIKVENGSLTIKTDNREWSCKIA